MSASHFSKSERSSDEFKEMELSGHAFPEMDDLERPQNVSFPANSQKMGVEQLVPQPGVPKRSSNRHMRALSASIAKLSRLRASRYCLIQIHNIRGIDLTMGGLSLFLNIRWLVLQ